MRPTNHGFTLIELLMAVVLVAILSAVALPNFIDFSKEAKTAVTNQKLQDLKLAIAGDPKAVSGGQYTQPGFIVQVGVVPASLDQLHTQGALPTYDPFSKMGWRGPYISASDPKWNLDGWDTQLQYNAGTRTIRSCGPNKACNDADDLTVTF